MPSGILLRLIVPVQVRSLASVLDGTLPVFAPGVALGVGVGVPVAAAVGLGTGVPGPPL